MYIHGELLETGTRRPISRPKKEHFLNRFTGKHFLSFHELKLFYHGIKYPEKYLHTRWELGQIEKENGLFGKTVLAQVRTLAQIVTNSYLGWAM